MFRLGRSRRIRQSISFSRASKRPDEALKLASGDREHPGLNRLHLVGVRNAFGCKQYLASAGPAFLVPDAIAHLTFEYVEDFILVVVDVQGGESPCEERCSSTERPSEPSCDEMRMVTWVLRNQRLR